MVLFHKKKKQSNTPRRRQVDMSVRQSADTSSYSDVFRRNRTLTGTTSHRLDTTGGISDLKSPRAHAHSLTMRRRKLTSVLLIVVLSAAFLWILISNFTARTEVVISDTSVSKPIPPSLYENAIESYLDSNPIARLHFVLNTNEMTKSVEHTLPEVGSITLTGPSYLGTTQFAVAMRVPVAGWKIGDKQYYVDADGVPFQQNYYSPPDVQIVDDSGAQLKDGAAVASTRFLSFVGRVVSLSEDSGLQVTHAILPAGTTRQLEVRLKGHRSLVRLSIDRPPAEQVEDMSRAVQYFKEHGQSPAYIDVRVSGKAFYK
ncbi:MAG TPA: hypothetical protein VFS65_02185 [Candidatus Saccharimonadales bacterium]|nr:hypothetical protein [Candidatus Saccharimonadales bacterium]